MEAGLFNITSATTTTLIDENTTGGSIKSISICNCHASNDVTVRLFLSDGTNDTKLHIAKIFDVSWSNMSMAFIDDIGIWDSDQSANISTFHNSGTPLNLGAYSPALYYRFGDVPTDITAYPLLTDEGSTGSAGILTAYTGTVADYQTDTPP